MNRPLPDFVGGAYKAASWKASNQRCVNLYVENDPEYGAVLYGTPGLGLLAALGGLTTDRQILGLLPTPKGLIFATESRIYHLSGITTAPDGTITLGTFTFMFSFPASESITFAQAGNQWMAVAVRTGGAFGMYGNIDGTGLVNLIVDPDFPPDLPGQRPISCTAIDGLFVVNRENSDAFQWSAPFDPSSWGGLDFETAENLNDSLLRPLAVERNLYLVGDLSTEVWQLVGGDDVFDRIGGTYIPYGTPARRSVADIGGSLLFLAQDKDGGRMIISARSLQHSRVSTHAIENEWLGYSVVSDAFAFTYMQRGHQFYVITFPTAEKTWVYDITTGLWHERSSQVPLSSSGRREGPWTPTCHAFFGGYNIVGGRNNPILAARLYMLRQDVYVDEIGTIARFRRTPHRTKNFDYFTWDSLEVIFQPGTGIAAGLTPETVNPQATLRISKDGGRTWLYERRTSIGQQGKYRSRAKFNRLGRARDFVVEVGISGPVEVAMIGAVGEFSE